MPKKWLRYSLLLLVLGVYGRFLSASVLHAVQDYAVRAYDQQIFYHFAQALDPGHEPMPGDFLRDRIGYQFGFQSRTAGGSETSQSAFFLWLPVFLVGEKYRLIRLYLVVRALWHQALSHLSSSAELAALCRWNI